MKNEGKANHNSVDIIKTLCCILIVGSHCLPVFHSDVLNYYYGQWLFRFCVPFFFVSTGYFFFGMEAKQRWHYIFRIILLYFASTLLYFPLLMRTGFIRSLIFGYHHLWYLVALVFGLLLYQLVDCIGMGLKEKTVCSAILLGGGYSVRRMV